MIRLLVFTEMYATDAEMIQELNTFGYFKYIFLTFFGKGFAEIMIIKKK